MWAFFSPVLLTAVILDFPSVSLGQAKGLSWNRHIVRIALGLQILKAPRHRPTSSRRLIKLSCSFLDCALHLKHVRIHGLHHRLQRSATQLLAINSYDAVASL